MMRCKSCGTEIPHRSPEAYDDRCDPCIGKTEDNRPEMEKTLLSLLSRLADMHDMATRKSGPDGIPQSAVDHYEAQRRDSIHELQDLIEALRKGGGGPQVTRPNVNEPSCYRVG